MKSSASFSSSRLKTWARNSLPLATPARRRRGCFSRTEGRGEQEEEKGPPKEEDEEGKQLERFRFAPRPFFFFLVAFRFPVSARAQRGGQRSIIDRMPGRALSNAERQACESEDASLRARHENAAVFFFFFVERRRFRFPLFFEKKNNKDENHRLETYRSRATSHL